APLERPTRGYRGDAVASTGSVSICLAFSGGGTRAAALAYGVLEELRDQKLLDRVDAISSVSGGSFPAAYYALFGERTFQEFRPRFLERNFQAAITRRVAGNAWWLWADPTYKRSDLVAELYDEALFEGKTYADLLERGRPFLIVNATDMTNGQRFEFT